MSCPSSCGCPAPSNPALHTLRSGIIAVACFLQAPLIAYMANLEMVGWLISYAAGLLVAWGVFELCERNALSRARQELLVMLALGNFGMLVGWLADVQFLPLIRGSVCLCGCPKSPLGWGILAHFNWMQLGMLSGGMLGMALLGKLSCNWKRLIACNLAMLAGMLGAASLIALVPILHPTLHFFVTIAAMIGGMIAAMEVYKKLPILIDARRSL